MSELNHLAVYLTNKERADFEKFAVLKRVSVSSLGKKLITEWMDSQKSILEKQGYDFDSISESLDNVFTELQLKKED